MTRFARAKGSKASNEKLPESATSWTEMKQELLNKNKELSEKKEREAVMKKREESYRAFLQEREEEEEKKVQWADFPEANQKNSAKPMNGVHNKFTKTKQIMNTQDSNDESDDETFMALKAQIDQALAKNASNQNKTAATTEGNESDSDALPDEAGVKIKPAEVVVKKAKRPKQMLKILVNKAAEGFESDTKKAPKTKPLKELSDKDKKLVEKKYERQHKQMEKKRIKRLNDIGNKQISASSVDKSDNFDGSKSQEDNEKEVESQIIFESNNLQTEMSDLEKLKLEKRLERRKRQKEKRQLKRQNAAKNEPENLSEQDLKKIEKKKSKLARQAEKRKQFKAENLKGIEVPAQEPRNKALHNEREPVKNKINAEKKLQKKIKSRDLKDHQRRKDKPERMIINGKTVDVDYIDGFPVKKEDADRLRQLRKVMISNGLPRSEINASLKLERRKAEKAFAREKKKVCFKCRKSGHNLSECPELDRDQVADTSGTGICFKCGSTEHTHFECKVVRGMDYKFATCFICKEQGHISKQCPDNQRGLYPKGGACKVCGDVTHLKKDCPKYQAQQAQLQNSLSIGTLDNSNPDDFDSVNRAHQAPSGAPRRLNKVIKF